MKRLIKADLAAILRLAGEYRFLAADRLELSIGRLCRQEYTDFLFLAGTPWCWLFDLSAVYDSGTYANLAPWPTGRPRRARSSPCSSISTRRWRACPGGA